MCSWCEHGSLHSALKFLSRCGENVQHPTSYEDKLVFPQCLQPGGLGTLSAPQPSGSWTSVLPPRCSQAPHSFPSRSGWLPRLQPAHLVAAGLCSTLRPLHCSPPGSSIHGTSQMSTGVGGRSFLQGVFPTQGSDQRRPRLCWQVHAAPLCHPGRQGEERRLYTCRLQCPRKDWDTWAPLAQSGGQKREPPRVATQSLAPQGVCVSPSSPSLPPSLWASQNVFQASC